MQCCLPLGKPKSGAKRFINSNEHSWVKSEHYLTASKASLWDTLQLELFHGEGTEFIMAIVVTPDSRKAIDSLLQSKRKGMAAHTWSWCHRHKKLSNRSHKIGIWWQMERSAGSVHPALFGPYSETTRINT